MVVLPDAAAATAAMASAPSGQRDASMEIPRSGPPHSIEVEPAAVRSMAPMATSASIAPRSGCAVVRGSPGTVTRMPGTKAAAASG
jgi:hypothetical protein